MAASISPVNSGPFTVIQPLSDFFCICRKRFGYNDKNSCRCSENLFLIAADCGINFRASVPVTVYLNGMLTRPDLSGYSLCKSGKDDQSKPDSDIRISDNFPAPAVVISSKAALSWAVFLLVVETSYIQKRATAYSAESAPSKVYDDKHLLSSEPRSNLMPPLCFVLAISQQLDCLIALLNVFLKFL